MIPRTLLERRMIRRRLQRQPIAPCRSSRTPTSPDGRALPVTTPYRVPGTSWAYGYHTGEDYAAPIGSLAVSVVWGTVVAVGDTSWGEAYGTMVIVRDGRGRLDLGYCHLSAARVTVGQKVRPGTVVGLTGDTGNTHGAHLHFEVRPAGGRYGSDVHPSNARNPHRK